MRWPPVVVVAALVVAPLAAARAHAAQYLVPSAGTPTLQAAVAGAAVNDDAANVISLVQSPVYTTARVLIDNSFHAGHALTIRPLPGLAHGRAILASQNGSEAIVQCSGAGSVTLQDLDLLRYSTNNADLVMLDHASDVLIERCRIGSVWSSVGSAGRSNVSMSYPERVTVRNCILFSALYGNFEYGLRASIGDDGNSLFLYNNTIADYDLYGIEISDQLPLSVLALHNNVVLNRAEAAAEPFAFHSNVAEGVVLVTSHNTAFASLANAEVIAAGQRISGLGGAGWRRSPRADAGAGFVSMSWDMAGPLDPNRNQAFFRLDPVGLLHDEAADLGVNLLEGLPAAIDHAVTDDWEHDPRPSGSEGHTDRGADQVEKSTTSVAPLAGTAAPLRIANVANAAADARLEYAAAVDGMLRVDVLDVCGRRMQREDRAVARGESGTIRLPAALPPGVYLYSATLLSDLAPSFTCGGRIIVLR